MNPKAELADDQSVIEQILAHIDNQSTDLDAGCWREPVEHYLSPTRFDAECRLLRQHAVAFCPSAAFSQAGAYVAREAAGTPIVAVRGRDGQARAFRNACRHRGMQLVDGAGCKQALACPYHGWTYDLSGALRNVPHAHGFPGLDFETHGLVPVNAEERDGLLFVVQDGAYPASSIAHQLPMFIPQNCQLFETIERDVEANWKLAVESFLEGYHIRTTHNQTFYPVQYDNLNVVEHFGRNSRVAFPYQAINKLRDVAPQKRHTRGKLTYVYHLFPNVMVATFPGQTNLVILEPLAVDRTRFITYGLTNVDEQDLSSAKFKRGNDLIEAGIAEDREMICAVQRGLASGANECFEFGLFEGAISHFHRALQAELDAAGQ